MRLALIGVLVVCVWAGSATAQAPRLGARVGSATDGYDQVLARHAKTSGFDYLGLAKDADSRRKLETYLAWAGRMPEGAPLADWLNTYNATVLAAVTAKLPLASVMDDKGFFKAARHRIAGKLRSLDEVENEIIRPRFQDARVHFALNCAARSCPTLHNRAFRGQSLGSTLDVLTRRALSDERHMRLTALEIELSALFFWFEADFARDSGSVRAFLRRYVAAGIASKITDTRPLKQREYDWALNQAR